MKAKAALSKFLNETFFRIVTILCGFGMVSLGQPSVVAQQPPQAAATSAPAEEAPKISNAQLDSLVAPIALYPDELLAQTLAASTYPLEIIQLQQWMERNKNLKDKALADAVTKQPWDPSIQAMAAFPDVVPDPPKRSLGACSILKFRHTRSSRRPAGNM